MHTQDSPENWSADRMAAHAAEWCGLPLRQVQAVMTDADAEAHGDKIYIRSLIDAILADCVEQQVRPRPIPAAWVVELAELGDRLAEIDRMVKQFARLNVPLTTLERRLSMLRSSRPVDLEDTDDVETPELSEEPAEVSDSDEEVGSSASRRVAGQVGTGSDSDDGETDQPGTDRVDRNTSVGATSAKPSETNSESGE